MTYTGFWKLRINGHAEIQLSHPYQRWAFFDGHHSAAEMIRRAEEIGYEEIGISNHLVYHPNLLTTSPMFFNDFDLLKKMMQKNVDDIRRAAEKASIPVYAGFEVDFFPSAMWRNAFEKLTETLNADYYVGSFHFLRNTDESRVYNMYHYKESGSPFTPEELADAVRNYWRNVCLAAESGYFDFIAHLDVYKIFPILRRSARTKTNGRRSKP